MLRIVPISSKELVFRAKFILAFQAAIRYGHLRMHRFPSGCILSELAVRLTTCISEHEVSVFKNQLEVSETADIASVNTMDR